MRASGLATFFANSYGCEPANVFHHINSGKRRNMPSGTGVHHGDALGSALFFYVCGDAPRKMRTHFKSHLIEVAAYKGDIGTELLELAAVAVQAVPFLVSELVKMEVVTNDANMEALLPPGEIPITEEVAVLAGVGVGIAEIRGCNGGNYSCNGRVRGIACAGCLENMDGWLGLSLCAYARQVGRGAHCPNSDYA